MARPYLRACPFCRADGEDNIYFVAHVVLTTDGDDYESGHSVNCVQCGAEVHGEYEEETANLWNGVTDAAVAPATDRDTTKLPASELTDAELPVELARVEAQWDALFADPDFDGHSGPPVEWMAERMGKLRIAIERRATLSQ